MTDRDLERAVDEIMAEIDGHRAASGDVPREVSIDYYRQIATECRERADQIQRELDDES